METDSFSAPTLAPFLLIVEPDVNDAELLIRSFRNLGYRTKWSPDGFDAMRQLRVTQPDMVIINSLLPDMYGMQVLEQIQAQRKTLALVMVDSQQCDLKTIMDASGNDFLFKPLNLTEVAFRVSRIFQGNLSQSASEPETQEPISNLCRFGPIRIDSIRQLARFEQHKIELTQTQFRLLEHLARNPGIIFDRDQLHGVARITSTQVNVVDVHIYNLRSQLQVFKLGYLIETVRGQGYRGWQDPNFLATDQVDRLTGQMQALARPDVLEGRLQPIRAIES
jgi:two-component system, OmpR family, response regulator AdeR